MGKSLRYGIGCLMIWIFLCALIVVALYGIYLLCQFKWGLITLGSIVWLGVAGYLISEEGKNDEFRENLEKDRNLRS